jgi:hypothetical protein
MALNILADDGNPLGKFITPSVCKQQEAGEQQF